MRGLWTVTRQELRLLVRGWGIWVSALLMVLLGVWAGSMLREQPTVAWSQLMFGAMLATLVLALSTGDQVVRDRERRVDGVLLATPITTTAYVLGKYVAATGMLLALSVVQCVAAFIMDRFDTWRDPPAILGHSIFPPFGPTPFMGAWVWLCITPVIFGAALTLAGITLGRGQRVLAYVVVLAFWLIPLFTDKWPNVLDLTCLNVCRAADYGDPTTNLKIFYDFTEGHRDPATVARAMQFMQQHLPPGFPAVFYWNRAIFVGLAVLLVAAAVGAVARQRRGHV